jgi:putative ABC transport system ATP-binding protein
MELLAAEAVSHAFDYELFSDISLHVNSKETIAITGVSGSGKSTFLHILTTLLKPKSGIVRVLGKETFRLNEKELLTLRSCEIGIVFQAHYLFRGFTGVENIEVAAMLSEQDIDTKLLEKLHISDVIAKRVTDLSGGQQQRVSIARVLTKKPRIIFADEPTGNLDTQTAKEVMDIFEEYVTANDAALVIVTHDEGIAARCDKIFHLEDKQLFQIEK